MEEAGIVENVANEHHFWARNGAIIKSLPELKTAIEQMDDGTFMHHVNNEKNDFSEWVIGVIKDEKLAKDISKTTSKEDISKLIEKRIEKAKKKAQKKKAKKEKRANKKIVRNMGEKEEKNDTKEKTSKIVIPSEKIEEILQKEKEIEKKEEKIREIEEKIEKRLGKIKNSKNTKFFSKEFVQGLIVGLLLAVLGILVYIKFFAV